MQKDRRPHTVAKPLGPLSHISALKNPPHSLISVLLGISMDLKMNRAGVLLTGKPTTSDTKQYWSWWSGTAKLSRGGSSDDTGSGRHFYTPQRYWSGACEG